MKEKTEGKEGEGRKGGRVKYSDHNESLQWSYGWAIMQNEKETGDMAGQ
jgi:hypothetical protein